MPNIKARHVKALTLGPRLAHWMRLGCPVELRNRKGTYYVKWPFEDDLPQGKVTVLNQHTSPSMPAAVPRLLEEFTVNIDDVVVPYELFG